MINAQQERLQDKFNEELVNFQLSNTFPKEDIPLEFNRWAKIALSFIPVAKNNITGEEFKEMMSKTASSEYNLFEFGIALNGISHRSMKDFNMELTEYCDMLAACAELQTKYNDIIKPEAAAIQQRIQYENGRSKTLKPSKNKYSA